MKTLVGFAIGLALISTPAFARSAHHSKHVRHHHLVFVANQQTAFGTDFMGTSGWNAEARAPGFTSITSQGQGQYAEMVARHAAANGVPVSLVHRVIMRESRYNPRAVSKGNYGMMQIRLGTARTMGYSGTAEGLLDPEVNMTYGVKYLAGAYKAAGGSEGGAVSNYARGYYRQAKSLNLPPYEGPVATTVVLAKGTHTKYGAVLPIGTDRHAVF